jgi:coenzyme F420-0:L-glutamate ligase / coenzyme F420-1:gamma-L-glutamate ligase
MTIEILPIEGLPEVADGQDLGALLTPFLRTAGVRSGDVVVVTQKVVSKAEGRVVAGEDRGEWIARETVEIVARRGDLVIARTRHGFVCANAGVDASNVAAGALTLLPEDPDGTAARLRRDLMEALGVERLGVVITDTFGRPWREGLVDVAIGVAGMPAVVDLRGTPDHTGQPLEVTIVALADQVAAAAGMVMGKAARVPVAIVRGVDMLEGAEGRGADLVRTPESDLFPRSPLQALRSMRPVDTFGPGDVPRAVVEDAVEIAAANDDPDATGEPLRFLVVDDAAGRRRVADAMNEPALEDATALIAPLVRIAAADAIEASSDSSALARGAAIHTLMLALHAGGAGSRWSDPPPDRDGAIRAALELDEGWRALGVLAAGPIAEGEALRPRPRSD